MNPATYQPEHFAWGYEAGVATITLDRPEKKNPLTFDSYAELGASFRALVDADEVKAVVLAGAGGNFSSGGDVHEIIGPLTERNMPGLLQFTRLTGELVRAMRACPQPIIAAVEGVCAGAGAIMAMASDLRVAATDARTAFLFTRVGLAGCDMGACAILPRIIGQGRAADLLYSGRFMSAEEGEAWGFYNRIVAGTDVLSTATGMAADLAAGPSFAHGMTKRQLTVEANVSLETALEMEAQAQAICMATKDFRRAFEAFAGRTKPRFEGD
ncbi:MAG: enoyl-CoA hydratase family protein [Erythrobacter sp.]|jgi:enoyl-CoA hydratase/carnithine racemase|nr:enoyl-CoA hydratase family protein [Erythrobacter sp.]